MKRFILLAGLLFILHFQAMAQDEEIPSPPRRHSQPKIGGAGGFTPSLLFINFDPINDLLKKQHAAAFGNNPMLLLGGQGYGYIMVLPNLRIGGVGLGGSIASKSIDTASFVRRDVDLNVTFGGVTVDYVVPVIPRLDLTFGLMLGSGGMTLTMTRDEGNPKLWDNLWNQYGSTTPTSEYTRRFQGSFFAYQPSINIEYALLRWVGLRVGVSYNGLAAADWKLDDKYELIGVPGDVSSKGWMINTGIFLGTFIY